MPVPDRATVEAAWRLMVERTARELASPDPVIHAEWQRLHAMAPAWGRLLREQFGATEVWLFGSLAAGCPEESGFHDRSDVDLAVVGVPEHRIGPAEGEVAKLAKRVVELFDLETLPADFAARIRREGMRL